MPSKRSLTEEELEIRVAKLWAWLDWMHVRYDDLLSREESAGAPSGFAEPRVIRRGGAEWVEVDPYSQDVHVGVKVNESTSSKKAHQAHLRDEVIDRLQRNERVRAGREALPDRSMANYLRVARKPHGQDKIEKGLELLQILRPDLYDRLPSKPALRAVVIVMHRLVPGRFPNPPSV